MFQIQPATLEHTQHISTLFRAQISSWQRLNQLGQGVDTPYDDLNLYERWSHGGAWMSLETSAVWLNHLLRGAGLPFILRQHDQIVGYVETYISDEAPPIGKHLNIGQFVLAPHANHQDALPFIMEFLFQQAKPYKRISTTCAVYDAATTSFYKRYDFAPLTRIQQVSISAQTGQGFYKAIPHPNADATQIASWQMPIGRNTSARQQWEQHWSNLWVGIPQLAQRRVDRLRFSAAGQDAFVYVQQQPYDARSAEVSCWTNKPLTPQFITSLRDWSHRQGYRVLVLNVIEASLKLFGTDAEAPMPLYEIWSRDV